MSRLEGLQNAVKYILLNVGADLGTTEDISQSLSYINDDSLLDIEKTAFLVAAMSKESDYPQEQVVNFLSSLASWCQPFMSNYSSNVLINLISNAYYGNIRIPTYRLVYAEIFIIVMDKFMFCDNCMRNGTLSYEWRVSKKGKIKCLECDEAEDFKECDYCDSEIFRLSKKGNIKCVECDEKHDFAFQSKSSNSSAYTKPKKSWLYYFLSMAAKIHKADGRVSREEINHIKFILDKLELDREQIDTAIEILNEAKNSNQSFENFANDFYNDYKNNETDLDTMLWYLMGVAAADGELHPDEDKMILYASKLFGLKNEVYEEAKRNYFNIPTMEELLEYYEILECTPQDSDQTIKRKYRELQIEYHPDKHINVKPQLKKLLDQKIQEINKAYEVLKKVRKGL